jgi:hypothetical protein
MFWTIDADRREEIPLLERRQPVLRLPGKSAVKSFGLRQTKAHR